MPCVISEYLLFSMPNHSCIPMNLRIKHLVPWLLLTMACQNDGVIPKWPHWGQMGAKLNGQRWKYSGWTNRISAVNAESSQPPCPDLYVYIAFFDKRGNMRQGMSFTNLPRQKQTLPVTSYPESCQTDSIGGFFNATIADDVLGDVYKVLKTENNYLGIESFDSDSKELKGWFQITFVLADPIANRSSDLPDTLRFTEGRFHTKIVRR